MEEKARRRTRSWFSVSGFRYFLRGLPVSIVVKTMCNSFPETMLCNSPENKLLCIFASFEGGIRQLSFEHV